ncbi:MAG: PilZ domain-containing protein [Oligoflexia bacterium]|nr:PilZ domain-containing protein [Oligoflexia bacterium]
MSNFVYLLDEKKWFQLGEIESFSSYLPKKPEMVVEKPIFYICIKEVTVGPFTKSEIVNKLNHQDISCFDFVFNQETGVWKRIKQLSNFTDSLPKLPTLIPFIKSNQIDISGNFDVTTDTSRQIVETDSSLQIKVEDIFEEDFKSIKSLVIRDLPFEKNHSSIGVNDLKEEEELSPSVTSTADPASTVEVGAVASTASVATASDVPTVKPVLVKNNNATKTNRRANKLERNIKAEVEPEMINDGHTKTNSTTNGHEIKNDPVWIIEKGEKNLGPFCYLEVLKMLQKNVISKNAHIKKKNATEWKRIEEIYEFNTNIIRKIVTDKGRIVEKIFVPRKHKRTSYLGPAAITYRGKVYRGTCSSISEGGCFIEMRPSDFELAAEIHLKIMPGTVPLMVECTGKIVSINERGPKGIGIKFTNLGPKQMDEVRKIVERYSSQIGG